MKEERQTVEISQDIPEPENISEPVTEDSQIDEFTPNDEAEPEETPIIEAVSEFTGDTGEEYEYYVAVRLEQMGYFGIEVTPLSGDYGADILAYDPTGKRVCIQCKKYAKPVGNAAVQQIFTAKSMYDCDIAMVVTTSTFTKSAVITAEKTGVILIPNFK